MGASRMELFYLVDRLRRRAELGREEAAYLAGEGHAEGSARAAAAAASFQAEADELAGLLASSGPVPLRMVPASPSAPQRGAGEAEGVS